MTICLNKPTHTYNSSSTGTRGAGPPPCAVQQQQLVVMFSFLLLLLLLYPHFFFVVFLSHARVAEEFREFQLFSDGRQQQQQQPEVFLLTPIHQHTYKKGSGNVGGPQVSASVGSETVDRFVSSAPPPPPPPCFICTWLFISDRSIHIFFTRKSQFGNKKKKTSLVSWYSFKFLRDNFFYSSASFVSIQKFVNEILLLR